MEDNKPNYYAILTAEVRYDKTISDKAKLIYAELTALSNTNGYAHPSNQFLAELYGCSERQISRILTELSDRNYINIEVSKTKKGAVRKIFLTSNPLDKNVYTPLDKNVYPHTTKMSSGNNKVFNNTRTNTTSRKKESKESVKNTDTSLVITLDLVSSIAKQLNLKNINPDKVYNYLLLNNFKLKNGLVIDALNLRNYLQLWASREADFSKVDTKDNDPEWLSSYLDEVENWGKSNEQA